VIGAGVLASMALLLGGPLLPGGQP